MIITRAPLRMSFAGGGSDLPSYYEQFGGAVVSTAIDKYVYVTINKKFDDAIRISYSQTEIVETVSEVQHPLIRACMSHTGVTSGIEITTIADIPSKGTGLGSSSAFTVALLQGLYACQGKYASAEQLAEEACHIEIDVCGAPIGKQDQYATAFGGLNYIQFMKDGQVDVKPILCPCPLVEQLQEHLIMFYTGRTRSASNILARQSEKTKKEKAVQTNLQKMVAMSEDMRTRLQQGDLTSFGEILGEGWRLKRDLTEGISDSLIDDWYDRGVSAGAIGGKILGAGAGGFLIFYAPPERHQAICHSLPELRQVPVSFERAGSNVIFYRP